MDSKILAPSKVHNNLAEDVKKRTNFISVSGKTEYNYVHAFILFVPPIIGIYGLLTAKLMFPTFILAFFMYAWTGLGITAGYHRLWSHRAYSANWALRFFLCLGGAGAMEGSAKWWCRNHRAHHRYTDTEKDPYNAKRGFWYAHMGWMLEKQPANKIGFADISDLNRDPMIMWQHNYYPYISIGVGLVLPTLVGALWGDALGAYFYAGIWKMLLVHHATFFVNSLAHWSGEKTFSDHHTANDSFFTAVMTFGEGYHNYHHEFPQDYRNGVRFFHYDPTKWLVAFCALFGITYDLKMISNDEIRKAKIQMNQRTINNDMAKLIHGKKFDQNLPFLDWSDIKSRNESGDNLVVIEGMVYDVKEFVHEHPGGRQTLLNFIGTDSSDHFLGKNGSHSHSKEARKFLDAMRIGIFKQSNHGA